MKPNRLAETYRDALVKRIEKESGVSEGEVRRCLTAISAIISDDLSGGVSFDLPGVGKISRALDYSLARGQLDGPLQGRLVLEKTAKDIRGRNKDQEKGESSGGSHGGVMGNC